VQLYTPISSVLRMTSC